MNKLVFVESKDQSEEVSISEETLGKIQEKTGHDLRLRQILIDDEVRKKKADIGVVSERVRGLGNITQKAVNIEVL